MYAEYDQILLIYEIRDIVNVCQLKHGNTSKAAKVVTKDTAYILRTLHSRWQGEWEYQISEYLGPFRIAPRIIPTKYGAAYAVVAGNYYNLQEFIATDTEVTQGINSEMLGQTIGTMHYLMNQVKLENYQEDRFKLETQYTKALRKWNLTDFTTYVPNLDELVHELKILDTTNDGDLIHGDLGKWNMLFHSDQITVIDFGEVRYGSRYMDLAAVVTSIWGKVQTVETCKSQVLKFLDWYTHFNGTVDYAKLISYIKLWNLRGFLSILTKTDELINAVNYYDKLRNNESILIDVLGKSES
ncbi:hypothetical protein E0485_04635 [Paenibacillus albiflavus]|uniref:Aminoglycoside phosphotransferase domain-containing protein n=1 Tax=Paenibacillus albiflavus TaxID=2545760 RepID=A0A4R4ELC2_9BACL|nr:phosphotransferase [Paenibacillus albiflavus]TCZ80140.1 hypothetical protein E0485_04635 [Paenibacillus albiflavus]